MAVFRQILPNGEGFTDANPLGRNLQTVDSPQPDVKTSGPTRRNGGVSPEGGSKNGNQPGDPQVAHRCDVVGHVKTPLMIMDPDDEAFWLRAGSDNILIIKALPSWLRLDLPEISLQLLRVQVFRYIREI
jgi:hypothetical protein